MPAVPLICGSQAVGVGLTDHRIVVQRVLEYPDQVLGGRGERKRKQDESESRGAIHGVSL